MEVAAVNGQKVCYLYECQNRKASETLLSLVDSALNQASLELKNADFIACCIGPGSFTGIRIGVTTARAFCQAIDLKTVCFTNCDVLAYNYMGGGTTVCFSDAGNGFIYAAVYTDGLIKDAPVCLKAHETPEYVKAAGENVKVVCEQNVKDIFSGCIVATPGANALTKAVEENYKKNGGVHYSCVTPLYIRLSQAETELK